MKTCAKCDTEKVEDEFYLLRTGRRHSYCKACCRKHANEDHARKGKTAEYRAKRQCYKRNYLNTVHGQVSRMLNSARQRAKRTGREMTLTPEWVTSRLLKGKCELTGWKLSFGPPEGAHKNPRAPSLDRIDSAKGYTPDNVRIVCTHANIAKLDFSDEQLLALAKAIVQTIGSRAPKGEGSTTRAAARRTKWSEAPGTPLLH